MSTNINITVGDNALLDRAKQQQVASRQTQLNRDASNRLEAQATAARTAALAAQGRDANGNPITGAPFTQPIIDRRPAANRQGGYKVATAFLTYPSFTATGTLTELIIQTANKNQTVTVPLTRPNPPVNPRTRSARLELFDKPLYWYVANDADPNYIPLPISWTGEISGEINNFPDSTVYYTNPRLIVMPAGGQNMILFLSDESVDVEGYVTWSATASATVSQIGSGDSAVRTATVTQTSPGETVTIYPPRFTLSQHCWVIGPNAIREISIPSAFEEMVKPFASRLVVDPSYTASVEPDNTSWMASDSFPETGVYNWLGFSYHTWGIFLSGQTTDPVGETNNFPLSSVWLDHVYTWGMATDDAIDASVGTQATWTTPAVFSMFGNGDSIRSAYLAVDPSIGYTCEHVLTSLLGDPSIKKPKEYLAFVRESDTKARFDIAKTLPLNYFDYSNALPLKKNPKLVVPVTTPAEQYTDINISYAWDWGNPGYCREKLLALGFTSADLTP
jgi:hypothetical protein